MLSKPWRSVKGTLTHRRTVDTLGLKLVLGGLVGLLLLAVFAPWGLADEGAGTSQEVQAIDSSSSGGGILGASASAFGGEEPIDYTGDAIRYDQAHNILRGEGNVIISHKNMSLRADRVIAYIETSDVYADGNVVLRVADQIFTGEKVHFNFKTKLGDFIHATAFVNPWYGKGESIRKAGPNEYQINGGYITSCDYEEPHYKIKAKKIYVYPKERLIAKDVVFSVGGVDVLWFPLFSRSLKDERERFSIIPGYNRRFGTFLLTGYNFWLDPYLAGTAHLDFYAKRGIGSGVDVQYQVDDPEIMPPMTGAVKSYFIDDQNFAPTQDRGVNPDDVRYRVHWEHDQQFPGDIRFQAELNALSDPSIIDDFFRDEFEKEVQPETFLTVTKNSQNYRASVFLRKRINNIFTELERLPELQFDTTTLPIGQTGLFYTTSNRAGYYHNVPLEDSDYDSLRADTFHELSYPFKVFHFLNLEPSMGLRETFYTSGVKQDNLFRTIVSGGIDAFVKMHKLYPKFRSEAWDIDQLRHVIEPRVTYTFVPHPTRSPEELLQFDGLDGLDRQNFFRFGVRNILQTRRDEETIDLVDTDLFVNYFPNSALPALDRFEKEHPFSDISYHARFHPIDWIALEIRTSYDAYNTEISSVLADIALIHGDEWNISFRHRQSRGQNNLSALEVLYRISEDWIAKGFWRYDFDFGKLEAQEYTILKDLHAWEVAFTFRQRKLRDDLTVFLVFRLKDFPDVPLKLGN